MRNILLLYNPVAGDGQFRFSLDRFMEIFSEKDYEVRMFRSKEPGDMAAYLKDCDFTDTEALFVAGGNGTINEVVGALMRLGRRVPIGLIPAGIENDFAKALGFGKELEDNLTELARMEPVQVDVACANNQYFINMCTGGALADIIQVSDDMRAVLGRGAYYLKGMSSLHRAKRFRLKIVADGDVYEDEFALFLIINGKFNKLDPENGAVVDDLSDGTFDFIAVKADGLAKLAKALVQIFRREPVEDQSILHLSAKHFQVELLGEERDMAVEIDGETGPSFPLDIEVHQQALDFFVGKTSHVPRGT